MHGMKMKHHAGVRGKGFVASGRETLVLAAALGRQVLRVVVIVLCAGWTGCGKKAASSSAQTNTVDQAGNPLTAPVDYLGAVNKAQQSAQKTVDTAALSQAWQQFVAAEGRRPQSLQELVTEGYLGRVPEPPRGTRFAIDPQTGAIKVVPVNPAPPSQPVR